MKVTWRMNQYLVERTAHVLSPSATPIDRDNEMMARIVSPGFAEGVSTILFGVTLALATLGLAIPSMAAPPVLYHSPADDGVPLGDPVEIAPGASFTAYLYLDGGTNASPETRCSNGTGDEVCFWNLSLHGATTLTISSFSPEAGIVHHQTASTLGINGGDPWRGDLGPRRVGEVVVQGGAFGGTLELIAGEFVDASLVVGAIAPARIVPEPRYGLSLLFGTLLLGRLARVRRKRKNVSCADRSLLTWPALLSGRSSVYHAFALTLLLSILASVPALAQTSVDCGDVVSDGVIDASDLAGIRRFLAGDPAAPDLQGDPQALLRCDVTGDGLCNVGDYARIRRYMIDLSGGLNETCPLAGGSYPPVVFAAPIVDPPAAATDRSSILLTGTGEPNELIRVSGVPSMPVTAVGLDGVWEVDVPLMLDTLNTLEVRRDFGGGYLSNPNQLNVTQSEATGESSISGFVFDTASAGTPIAGATVTAHGVSTTTETSGFFRIEDIPPGRVVVRVEHPGYVPTAVSLETETIQIGPNRDDFGDEPVLSMVPMAATQTIGAAGGTITTASGFELIVPAGSLASETPIAVTELWGSGAGASSFGGLSTVDIGPGPIVFDPPAILRLPFSGFTPGQPAGFVQVDQAAGASSPRIGSISIAGLVEVAVQSSAGDDFVKNSRAYEDEATFPNQLQGRSVEFRRPYSNCTGRGLTQDVVPRPVAVGYRPGPEAPRGPAFDKLVDEDLDSLLKIPGIAKLNLNDSATIAVPPGTIANVEIQGTAFLVEQPIYYFTFPADGSIERTKLLTVRYERLELDSVVIADVFDRCPKPKASVWGDPHLIRFDHVGEPLVLSNGDGRFDFQASGEFVLFESTTDEMVIQSRFQPANNSTTVTTAIAADVDGDRVTVYGGPTLDIRIEGVPTPLTVGVPVSLPGGGELERATTGSGNWDSVWIRWSDGSEALAYGWANALTPIGMSVFPTLAPARFAEVQGLLGNANGILTDDLNLRSGLPADPATLYTFYADSWRISQAESLFDYEPGEDTATYNGIPADPDFTVDDLNPIERLSAETTCIAAGVTDEPWLSDCIIDVVVMGDANAANVAGDGVVQLPDDDFIVLGSADANIFGAGLSSVPDFGGGGGNGSLPVEIVLPVGVGRAFRVLDSANTIQSTPSLTGAPPAGLLLAAEPFVWGEWGGLTGPITRRFTETMGVFLGSAARPVTAPPAFDCTNENATAVAPQIGQIFCLGDGLTPAGEARIVLVPDDATRVFFGQADRNVQASSVLTESAVHHLGDETLTDGLFSLAPAAEGSTWTSGAFSLPFSSPIGVRILVDLLETDLATHEIWINGQFAGRLPVTGPGTDLWVTNNVILIDVSLLAPSGNVLELRAAQSGGNVDDFLFQNLRLEVVDQL